MFKVNDKRPFPGDVAPGDRVCLVHKDRSLWVLVQPSTRPGWFVGQLGSSSSHVEFERRHIWDVVTRHDALVAWFMEIHKVILPTHPIHASASKAVVQVGEDVCTLIEWYQRYKDDVPEKQSSAVFATIALSIAPMVPEEPVKK